MEKKVSERQARGSTVSARLTDRRRAHCHRLFKQLVEPIRKTSFELSNRTQEENVSSAVTHLFS